jgi:arylsulfatase A-like enzyme
MKVVSFLLHGCPVSFLGAYGNEWVATPTLDRLAAEGVVFDAHYAAEPGRLPGPMPGRSDLVRSTRPANDAPAAYYAGWGEVVDARPDAKDGSPLDSLVRALPGVLDALAGVSGPDWHLGIELDTLLPPWHVPQDVFDVYVEELVEDGEAAGVEPWTDPPTGWFDADDEASWELLHRTFAAAMTVFDVKLGAVFDLLRERGLDRDTAWVFTAAAGFPLGEHGVLGYHRPWLHGELVHLPLIVRYPGGEHAGRRVSGFTQPEYLQDLSKLLDVQHEVAISRSTMNSGSEVAIRTAEWTYLHPLSVPPDENPRTPLLFTRPDDRWEVNDLPARNPEVVEDLANRVQSSAGGSS